MCNKLIINQKKEMIEVFVYQNGKKVEQYRENFAEKRLEGNIYLGKVKNVVCGMQSAFIDIGTEKNAFIHIKDIIPKESSTTGNEKIDVSKYNIKKLIKPNDKLIVQIKRDCNRNKGPRVTKDIKLVGKYAILMPFANFNTVSKKIEEDKERARLLEIAKKYNNYGIIIRTSANEKSEDIIIADINSLIKKWKHILEIANNKEESIELYSNNGIIGKLIDDFEPQGLEIITNSTTIKDNIQKTEKNIKIEIEENIEEQFEERRKINLKCGGFIIIDTTEALVAIDVNTGKFVGKNELEDTIVKVNSEAAEEIAKQIRLRDLGGIIIIDFIDMNNEEDREQIRKKMQEEIKKDRSKIQVLEFTKLGLLELTRKHIYFLHEK